MRSSRRVRWWVRGAVLVPALAVALWPRGDVAGSPGPATLPEELAGYSYLTGSVSASAPGRAIALHQHGFGVEFMDYPQAVVTGADGTTTRRLDVAEDRIGGVAQGDPAPMLLSPDGTRVAVGTHDDDRPSLLVVDLADGSVEERFVPAGRSALPVAWSADGERIAYLAGEQPTNPHSGVPITGDVGVLDLADGAAAALPGAEGAIAAAFAPDGNELAVQSGGRLGVVDAQDGGVLRTLALPAGAALGPAAWSPDGRLLALSAGDAVAFVDPTGDGGATPAPLDLGGHPVLGWTAADRVVLLVPEVHRAMVDTGDHWVTEVPLDGGEPQRLASVPTGGGNYGVSRFQLASGLLVDVEVAGLGPADRGPWPLWLRLVVALASAAVVARSVGWFVGRRTAATPEARGRADQVLQASTSRSLAANAAGWPG